MMIASFSASLRRIPMQINRTWRRMWSVGLLIGMVAGCVFLPMRSPAGLPGAGRPVLEVPPIDAPALVARDKALRTRFEKIGQFAEPCEVRADKADYGVWEEVGDGRVIWRLFISAPGATDINLGITEIFIPQGCQVRLVSADGNYQVGPYSFRDNRDYRQLWTPVVPGDWVTLEAEMPADVVSAFTLVVGQVNRGYADVFRLGFPGIEKQGACNNDVICPAGDNWRDEIRSVGVYSISGFLSCSGTLIMNQRADFKAYFLTANHCLTTGSEAATVVVYWNYQSPTCGALSGGSLSQSQSGASLRATSSPSDFTLLELSSTPSPAFNVYYAGWDRSGSGASAVVCIHHPNTDEKAISFENAAIQSTAYLSSTINAGANHWRIVDWDSGTTEPGSSGSGLWNASTRRLIGQLHGGYAACGNDLSDWYGKLSVSWTGGGSAGTRLSSWLDPDSTGLTGMDGSNPPDAGGSTLGDYDADGASDLAIYDTLSGNWYVAGVGGNTLADADQWGWSSAKVVAGDYNGDGAWDQAVFDTAGGYWYIKSLGGSVIKWKDQWGWSTAKPVPGDYNGDGIWDQAVFDTAGGYWYIKTVSGSLITWKNQWGWSTAKPVPGDYDGDGIYDLAVYDTAGGYWYIKRLSGSAITWKTQWGWSTAVPVPGDFDGDGVADLAVYDKVTGKWYIRSVSGSVIAWGTQWGWWNAFPVSLLDMPTPDSRTSTRGYYQQTQSIMDSQGYDAALSYARTAGAVGKVFVDDDGIQRTVRDLDIYDDSADVWVVGNGSTASRSWTTFYFYVGGSTLRMRVYLGW